jgi:hypothetical protein
MTATFEKQLEQWYQFVHNHDEEALSNLLADDVIFRSPVVWTPKHGKEVTMFFLNTVTTVFEDFKYHRIFTSENSLALEFTAKVGEILIKGIDLVQFNDGGKIMDFEVLVRPAKAVQALGEAMGKRLAELGYNL